MALSISAQCSSAAADLRMGVRERTVWPTHTHSREAAVEGRSRQHDRNRGRGSLPARALTSLNAKAWLSAFLLPPAVTKPRSSRPWPSGASKGTPTPPAPHLLLPLPPRLPHGEMLAQVASSWGSRVGAPMPITSSPHTRARDRARSWNPLPPVYLPYR